jgi:acetoin utilization deacetylase AcuC-like enzyme
MKTKIIFSENCLEYGEGHIEDPERIKIGAAVLKQKGYEFLKPKPVTEKDILLAHHPDYLEKIKKGEIEDSDTPAYENIYQYAKLSAGGAVLAAKTGGFSLMRPPGHHAGKGGGALGVQTKGFCYLNNIAIAIKYLGRPTLILDIDGHHGNGTEEIFFNDKKVIYISFHRYPYYPGTGFQSKGNCFNFPLEADCGEKVYLETFDNILNKIDLKKIKVVAVSAGFDAHFGDLASLALTEDSFKKIGERLGKLNKHTFFILEGGYIGQNIGNDANKLIKGFEVSG